ncbi:MAG: hypothetical protein ACI87E_001643 [Mariniblastus sp.]
MTTHDSDHSSVDDSLESKSISPASPPTENRRERFRLRLPAAATLSATINGLEYDVIEIAEHSLVVTSQGVFNKSGECAGEIQWGDGQTTQFTGTSGRLAELGRVVWGIEGVSTQHVIREQRRLLNSFPELRQEEFKIQIFATDG